MANWKAYAYKNDFPVRDGLIFYVPFEGSVNAEYSVGTGTGTLATNNLKLIMHFEEGTGTTYGDDSGNSNDFGLGAAPDWDADGKYGSALAFVRANVDWIKRDADVDFDIGAGDDFSMGAWVQMDGTGTNQAIFCKGTSASNGTIFFYLDTLERPKVIVKDTSGNQTIVFHTSAISDSDWHHVVLVRNTTDDKFYIYLDGVVSGTGTTDTTTGALTNALQETVGSQHAGGFPFDGNIDEPFFFNNVALTAEEITFLFENRWFGRTFFPAKFALGYYAFEGNSLTYPSTDGNILKDAGTVDMWVKPTWDGDDGIEHVFFTVNPTGSSLMAFEKHQSNVLFFHLWDETGTVKQLTYSVNGTNFASNTQHHLAVSWASDGTIKMYLNGVSVGNLAGAGSGKLTTLSGSNITIGKHSLSPVQYANSVIDELKIYRRALTAAEIKQNFEATRPLK